MIEILLATYNGGKYLAEQLDSIFKQDNQDFRILVRDDGSSDNTLDVLKSYQSKFADRITILETDAPTGSAFGNFSKLMEASNAEYVMFADQDDVWLEDKISKTMNKMQEMEEEHGKQCPILVHTDLCVVDNNMNVIDQSFWSFQNLHVKKANSLARQLVSNVVTGCTMMINNALLKKAPPVPQNAIMHDWWLAIVAAAFGKIGIVEDQTMLYRQHSSNEVGAKKFNFSYVVSRILDSKDGMESLLKTYKQAQAFDDRFKDELCANSDLYKVVKEYIGLYETNFVVRRINMLRYGFFKSGIVRSIGMFVRI